MQIFSFPPISDSKSKILILGTIPGKDSLKYSQYYAHPRNTFWKIVFAIFDEPFSENYEIKKQLLLKNNIAIWDVLKACERESSADRDILNEESNDLKSFLRKNISIHHLFFNGNKSMSYFMNYAKDVLLPFTVLPSTSPAYTITFENKLREWNAIKKQLNRD